MDSSLLKSLGIEWPVVASQALAVLVLFGVLVKFLFRPIEGILRQRQEDIANNIAGAEANRLQAESLRKEYEGHLAAIADEARAKLEQAMKDAEAARQRVLESAQQEVRDLHTREMSQLALEREQLRRELRTEMADIAVTAATKALRGNLTPQVQSSVIDQVIRELGDSPNLQA